MARFRTAARRDQRLDRSLATRFGSETRETLLHNLSRALLRGPQAAPAPPRHRQWPAGVAAQFEHDQVRKMPRQDRYTVSAASTLTQTGSSVGHLQFRDQPRTLLLPLNAR